MEEPAQDKAINTYHIPHTPYPFPFSFSCRRIFLRSGGNTMTLLYPLVFSHFSFLAFFPDCFPPSNPFPLYPNLSFSLFTPFYFSSSTITTTTPPPPFFLPFFSVLFHHIFSPLLSIPHCCLVFAFTLPFFSLVEAMFLSYLSLVLLVQVSTVWQICNLCTGPYTTT